MGFLIRWFAAIVSLVTAGALVYGTWRVWQGNNLELAAVFFSAAAIARSLLLAWLRRSGNVSALFRSKRTAFIKTPLQEAAFLLPVYGAPAIYAWLGLFETLIAVPVAWLVLRALVRMILERSAGKVEA